MTGRAARIVVLLLLGWGLASPGGAAARTSEQAAPASAWWRAADMALARGDCARALAILNEQVAGHHYGAVARLGDIHETGVCAHLSLPSAGELYERLIADGIEVAKARLGQLHVQGLGVTKDVARARRLFKEAVLWMVAHEFAERRRGAARELMGRHDVPPELEAELDWADGVENGPARQLYETALRLKDGIGLPKHEEAAKDWLQRAAHDYDRPEAYYHLWQIERQQADTRAERRQAFFYLERAAKLGHPLALEEGGLLLLGATTVKRWDFAAMVWLLMAKDAGADVGQALAEASSRLTKDERAVATSWARERAIVPAITPK